MTSQELIDSAIARLEALDNRTRDAFAKLDDEAANKPIPPSNWSPFQILDHLMKAEVPYLDQLPSPIAAATADGSAPARFSWFGKFIAKAASPGGNAPPPKGMMPDPGPMTRAKLDSYLAHSQRMREIAESARGRDLGSTRMNNPTMKIFKVTLADVFEIFAQHRERHIGQIESAIPKA